MQKLNIKLPTNTPLVKLIPLIVPLTILLLSDSVLSYAAPVYANKVFSSSMVAGLAISFSSLIGFLVDFFSKRLFGNKKFSFFIKTSFILSILFAYLLGISLVHKYVFFLAMAVWGIYYETMAFSNFKYLKAHVEVKNYSVSWGLISMLRSVIYGVGPLAATFMISYRLQLPSLICGTFVLIEFLVYLATFKNPKESVIEISNSTTKPEIKVWKILFKKIYPIWALNFVLLITDAGFWTAGVLLSENLADQSPMGRFFMTIYMLPSVFFSPLSHRISDKIGKKRTAIVSSMLASLFLIFVGLNTRVNIILFLVFAYSAFTALTYPAINATFEDYIKRLGEYDTDLIGLEQSSISLAYIVGPALAGLVSSIFSEQMVFSVFGFLLLICAIFALIVTPRKIRMPQLELSKV